MLSPAGDESFQPVPEGAAGDGGGAVEKGPLAVAAVGFGQIQPSAGVLFRVLAQALVQQTDEAGQIGRGRAFDVQDHPAEATGLAEGQNAPDGAPGVCAPAGRLGDAH